MYNLLKYILFSQVLAFASVAAAMFLLFVLFSNSVPLYFLSSANHVTDIEHLFSKHLVTNYHL